ncbi:MAG: DNA alkylation repair protein [Pseudomonadales bacterium]
MEFLQALDEVTQRTQVIALGQSEEATSGGFRRLYIVVPEVRKLVKQKYSFYELSANEIIKIWDYIWKQSDWYEVAHQAIYYYQHRTISKVECAKITTWINRCDCWAYSDDLSKIYAQVVEDNPDWIIPLYNKWSTSSSPWKRRQSVVGLIEYASKRKSVLPFDELIGFVEALLADKDYYVQKGVGWTLREIYNVYPAQALEFIEHHIGELSALAFSSSTEKLDKKTKARLKTKRKALRKEGIFSGQDLINQD